MERYHIAEIDFTPIAKELLKEHNPEFKPCPFCGSGTVTTIILDDECNEHDEEYEAHPYFGLWYGIAHDNISVRCPIARNEEVMGMWMYETRDEAILAWNTRLGKSHHA